MKKSIEMLLLLLSSTLAIRGNAYLLAAGLPAIVSISTAADGALVFYKLTTYFLLTVPTRHRLLRRLIDPVAKLEGYWIATNMSIQERPFSIARIQYNHHADQYKYSGSAYGPDYSLGATWKSTSMTIDLSNDQMWFFFESQLRDPDAEVLRGYGIIEFEQDNNGAYTRAKGFFVDSGTRFLKSHFLLDRVDTSLMRELIGRSDIRSNEDTVELLRACIDKTRSA